MNTQRNVSINQNLIGQPGSRAKLQTPALIIDLDALERNVQRMAEHAAKFDRGLRPHAKTHKSVRIAELQVRAGASGVCTATVGEAEVMTAGGIRNLLITSPAIGSTKIERVMTLNQATTGLMIVVDDAANASELAEASAAQQHILNVVVAFDVGSHRIGAAGWDDTVSIAKIIHKAPYLNFAGVHAYAGTLQHIEPYEERASAASAVQIRLSTLVNMLSEADMPAGLVSGAGTGTFEIDAVHSPYTELQTGSYIFTDVEYNRVALARDQSNPFEPSLFVRSHVISANHAGFATTDAGTKRFSMGGAMPEVVYGAPDGASYGFLGDEHGKLIFKDQGQSVPTGTAIELIPGHCDPTVNLYDWYHLVRGDTLVDIWAVDARGVI
jgi:D-serine deaminase-like pyridoxal phosphate-dependent protein